MKTCKHCGTTENLVKVIRRGKEVIYRTCEDCRRKITSASVKKLWKNPEYQKKQERSDEQKEHMSNKMTAIHEDLEYKEKHRQSCVDKWNNDGYRENISNHRKKLWKDPKYAKMMSDVKKANWADDSWRKNTLAKIKAAPKGNGLKNMKKTMATPEYRAGAKARKREFWKDNDELRLKRSDEMKAKWKDPKFVKKTLDAQNYYSDTKPEKEMEELLIAKNINYVKQKHIVSKDFRCIADFYLPDSNTVLEVDGKYWHNYPHGTDRDKAKDKFYKDQGFNVIRVWDDQIQECIVE